MKETYIDVNEMFKVREIVLQLDENKSNEEQYILQEQYSVFWNTAASLENAINSVVTLEAWKDKAKHRLELGFLGTGDFYSYVEFKDVTKEIKDEMKKASKLQLNLENKDKILEEIDSAIKKIQEREKFNNIKLTVTNRKYNTTPYVKNSVERTQLMNFLDIFERSVNNRSLIYTIDVNKEMADIKARHSNYDISKCKVYEDALGKVIELRFLKGKTKDNRNKDGLFKVLDYVKKLQRSDLPQTEFDKLLHGAIDFINRYVNDTENYLINDRFNSMKTYVKRHMKGHSINVPMIEQMTKEFFTK